MRAGIDAFNERNYEKTVAHFRRAVPLAEEEATKDDARSADLLVEAVKYYADLAPEKYLQSAKSSPEFAKYKAVTLGQCAGAGEPPPSPTTTESPGVQA